MWSTFVSACRALVPFLIENLIPLINFVVLLFVIVGMQLIRADLAARTKRFEQIERDLEALRKPGDGQR